MQNAVETADGKFVVIQNGQRVSAPTPVRNEAQDEADRRNKVVESSGQPVTEGGRAKVAQNLFG